MNLFLFNGFTLNSSVLSSQSSIRFSSFNPISSRLSIRRKPISATTIPARDRIIDFGKHRGKMLGTLPSKYLKWVSKNLRARDFEDWAKLADEVLGDPVYRDRLEWEFVEKILNGDGSSGTIESPVSDLLEISERFGWDNEDKLAWSRVDFALIGTTKGGRIPRKDSSRVSQIEKNGSLGTDFRGFPTNYHGEIKLGFSSRVSSGASVEAEVAGNVEGRRGERIERQRLKRGLQMRKVRLEIGGNKKKGEGHNHDDDNHDQYQDSTMKKTSNPFPGREALLKKVFNNRSVL